MYINSLRKEITGSGLSKAESLRLSASNNACNGLRVLSYKRRKEKWGTKLLIWFGGIVVSTALLQIGWASLILNFLSQTVLFIYIFFITHAPMSLLILHLSSEYTMSVSYRDMHSLVVLKDLPRDFCLSLTNELAWLVWKKFLWNVYHRRILFECLPIRLFMKWEVYF